MSTTTATSAVLANSNMSARLCPFCPFATTVEHTHRVCYYTIFIYVSNFKSKHIALALISAFFCCCCCWCCLCSRHQAAHPLMPCCCVINTCGHCDCEPSLELIHFCVNFFALACLAPCGSSAIHTHFRHSHIHRTISIAYLCPFVVVVLWFLLHSFRWMGSRFSSATILFSRDSHFFSTLFFSV